MAGQPPVSNPGFSPTPGVSGNPSPAKTPAELEQKIKDLESRLAELEAKKAGSKPGGEKIGSGVEDEDDDEIKKLKKMLEEAKADLKKAQANPQQGNNQQNAGAPPGNNGDIAQPAPTTPPGG